MEPTAAVWEHSDRHRQDRTLCCMNPRTRRMIVSGVLGGLLLIVIVAAIWQSWK